MAGFPPHSFGFQIKNLCAQRLSIVAFLVRGNPEFSSGTRTNASRLPETHFSATGSEQTTSGYHVGELWDFVSFEGFQKSPLFRFAS